jgi:hypothetical protein
MISCDLQAAGLEARREAVVSITARTLAMHLENVLQVIA